MGKPMSMSALTPAGLVYWPGHLNGACLLQLRIRAGEVGQGANDFVCTHACTLLWTGKLKTAWHTTTASMRWCIVHACSICREKYWELAPCSMRTISMCTALRDVLARPSYKQTARHTFAPNASATGGVSTDARTDCIGTHTVVSGSHCVCIYRTLLAQSSEKP
jgi:hypothetical protein